MSQGEAARRISEVTDGRIPPDRRYVLRAEAGGTDSLTLLRGMAVVYGVPFHVVLAANDAVQKM